MSNGQTNQQLAPAAGTLLVREVLVTYRTGAVDLLKQIQTGCSLTDMHLQ